MFVEFAIAKGIMGYRSAKNKARQAKQIGEYNAKVAEMNAKAEKGALVQDSRKLVKMQREEKAQQRMSVASRDGLETGGDLLDMINSAKDMQLDLLEIETKQDIALYRGKMEAEQARMGAKMQASSLKAQGRQALISGAMEAAGSFIK
jgi:hypothetical protein